MPAGNARRATSASGYGTEKVEQHLRDRFPDARIGRVDRDSVRRKGALTALLSTFAAGELDILVGTQMIAKGHDFPRVTLVGVISADVGLGLADFRAGERTFQLLTQVAGRAGAASAPVRPRPYPLFRALRIQSHRPDYQASRAESHPARDCVIRRSGAGQRVFRGRTVDDAMSSATDVSALGPQGNRSSASCPGAQAHRPAAREHAVQFFLKGAPARYANA